MGQSCLGTLCVCSTVQPRLLTVLRVCRCPTHTPSDRACASPPAGTASIVIPILLLLILLTVVAFVWYKWRIKG